MNSRMIRRLALAAILTANSVVAYGKTDCSIYHAQQSFAETLANMPNTTQSRETEFYKGAVQSQYIFYKSLLTAQLINNQEALDQLSRDASECGTAKVIHEKVSWGDLANRIGPEETARIKKSLMEARPESKFADGVTALGGGLGLMGTFGLFILANAATDASPVLAIAAIVGGGALMIGGTALPVIRSGPNFVKKANYRWFLKDQRKAVNQMAYEMSLAQTELLLGSGLK